MPRLITQDQAAKIAGVTQASIASLKKHNQWHFFVGSKVDTQDPSWQVYLRNREAAQFGQMLNGNGFDDSDPDFDDEYEETDPFDDDQKQEFRDIDIEYKRNRAIKERERAKREILNNRKLEGELIELKFVESVYMQHLGMLHKRLLDLPGNLADRVMQIAQSGDDNARQEIIDLFTKETEYHLQQTTDASQRGLDQYIEDLKQ